MRLLPVLVALLACALAGPSVAGASVTIGQDPDVGFFSDEFVTCGVGCTLLQNRLSNDDVRVPGFFGTDRGVVVRWRVKGSGGTARLRRLTVGAGGAATAREATAAATLTGATQQIGASLPVRAGDALAIELSAGTTVPVEYLGFGDEVQLWEPALGAGQAATPDDAAGGYVGYQAIIEPDADGDGLGDESQDSCVAPCDGDGGDDGGELPAPAPPAPPAPAPSPPGAPRAGDAPAVDPYAAIRKRGPKVTIAQTATVKRRVVSVRVTNPHAFAVRGTLQLRRGRTVIGRASVRLSANATKTVKVRVKRAVRRKAKLLARASLRGPVGKAATTTKRVTIGTARKQSRRRSGSGGGTTGGLDGTYGGSGAGADWVMAIENGVVTSFNGTMTLHCTRSGDQVNQAFSMVGDDPKPKVAPDGSYRWEATSGFGMTKLKFDGRVGKDGTASGNLVVEYRPPISGVSPVTGLPRMEFDYCFAGRDYTLRRRR